MKVFLAWLASIDRNELTFWLGLLLLFIGLVVGVSVATALIVTGAIVTGESILTSYIAQWFGSRNKQ